MPNLHETINQVTSGQRNVQEYKTRSVSQDAQFVESHLHRLKVELDNLKMVTKKIKQEDEYFHDAVNDAPPTEEVFRYKKQYEVVKKNMQMTLKELAKAIK